jgi:hypothetical protein
MNNIEIPLITINEFRERVLQSIVEQLQNNTQSDIINNLLTDGFPKFDKNELDKFVRDIQPFCFYYFETVAVEFGDSNMIWLVSGMDAILITKTLLKINIDQK